MMEAFQLSDDSASTHEDSVAEEHQLFLTVSLAAVTGQSSSKSFCLTGSIQGIPVSILLDSGSSHTFVSLSLAEKLIGAADIPTPVNVKVANGQIIRCSSFFPAAVWSMNDLEFQGDLRVLPLAVYDMILGFRFRLVGTI